MNFAIIWTITKRIAIGYVGFILLTLEALAIIAMFFGAMMHWASYVDAQGWERGVISGCAIILLGIGVFLWGEKIVYNPNHQSWISLPVIIRTNLVRLVWTLRSWLTAFAFLFTLSVIGWACGFSVTTDRVLFVVMVIILIICIPASYWSAPVERFTQKKQ